MSLVVKLYSPSQLLTQTSDGNRPESTKKKEVESPRLRPVSWVTLSEGKLHFNLWSQVQG